jgi:exopolysaccharide production protein ExoZ
MLLNVQMLRAIAAFLVVFVHLEKLVEMAGFPPGSTYFGNSGVDLFFVISGMIMVLTTAGGRQTALGFLRNRFTRIAPLYWSITLFVFGVAVVAPSLLQSTTSDPLQLLKSLAFIPFARADGAMHPTVFVGWTLNYEMAFYALFAAGMLLPGRHLGLAVTGGVLIAAVAAGQALKPKDPALSFLLQPIVLEFAGGMALGAIHPRVQVRPAWRWPAVAVGGAAFVVMLADAWLFPGVDRALAFGVPALVIVACAAIVEQTGLRANLGWVQLLGAASYAVYLTHFFCTQAVVKLFERLDVQGALAWAGVPLAFLLVALVGVAAHLRIELPLTELSRRWLAPARPRRPQTVAAAGSDGHVVDQPGLAEERGC